MRKSALFLLLVVFSGGVLAQDYVLFNGGISQKERAQAPKEGTRLVFFATGGAFVSGVSVTVSSQAGNELVNLVTEGPWLILDLPGGEYRVVAQIANGETQAANFTVNGTGREVGLMFTTAE